MDDLIKQIFSKEKDIRKNALIELSELSFDHLSDKELFDIYNQLELILENDEKDVSYFARKIIPKIKKVGKIRKLNLDEDPIHEVYTKKADELISLLTSDQKMVRINSVYALAKTGCSDKHIIALEKFAEGAPEDEAKLAIDSIDAIKRFMKDREEKEQQRKRQRDIAKKSLSQKKDYKARPVNNLNISNQNGTNISNNSSKWKKAFFILLFITILSTLLIYIPGKFFDQSSFIPENTTLLYKDSKFINTTIVLKKDNNIILKRFRLTFKGWKEVGD